MSFYISKHNTESIKIDDAMTITNYFGESTEKISFSFVTASLTGIHSKRKNLKCDQLYYVIKGNGKIVINDSETHILKIGDAVFLTKNSSHYLEGESLELIIVNSPSFDINQVELS